MANKNTARATEINRWINARVATRIASGLEPLEALREVLGAEVVASMIDEVYNTLRQTAPAPVEATVPERVAATRNN